MKIKNIRLIIGIFFQQISEADKVANISTSTLEASSSELTIIAAEGTATPQCKKIRQIKARQLR